MKHFDFFRHDLNLLVTFDALYAERSASKAAQRIGVTQSAVSHSLRRLRQLLDDELFVRTRNGLEPSALAIEISEAVRTSLRAAYAALVERRSIDTGGNPRCVVLRLDEPSQQTLASLLRVAMPNGPAQGPQDAGPPLATDATGDLRIEIYPPASHHDERTAWTALPSSQLRLVR